MLIAAGFVKLTIMHIGSNTGVVRAAPATATVAEQQPEAAVSAAVVGDAAPAPAPADESSAHNGGM